LRELALHILDIAENSIYAGATQIRIIVEENDADDFLRIVIEDNGKGMDADTLAKITNPFVTSRTSRKVGLGIPFFKAAAEACEGAFNIQSEHGSGTTVEAVFKHSHIDRMPLGDITGTFLTLLIGAPDVHWCFEYHVNERAFIFDDEPIKNTLDGVSLTTPMVLKYMREIIEEGIRNVRHQTPVKVKN